MSYILQSTEGVMKVPWELDTSAAEDLTLEVIVVEGNKQFGVGHNGQSKKEKMVMCAISRVFHCSLFV
jgi:hypothetical protein